MERSQESADILRLIACLSLFALLWQSPLSYQFIWQEGRQVEIGGEYVPERDVPLAESDQDVLARHQMMFMTCIQDFSHELWAETEDGLIVYVGGESYVTLDNQSFTKAKEVFSPMQAAILRSYEKVWNGKQLEYSVEIERNNALLYAYTLVLAYGTVIDHHDVPTELLERRRHKWQQFLAERYQKA